MLGKTQPGPHLPPRTSHHAQHWWGCGFSRCTKPADCQHRAQGVLHMPGRSAAASACLRSWEKRLRPAGWFCSSAQQPGPQQAALHTSRPKGRVPGSGEDRAYPLGELHREVVGKQGAEAHRDQTTSRNRPEAHRKGMSRQFCSVPICWFLSAMLGDTKVTLAKHKWLSRRHQVHSLKGGASCTGLAYIGSGYSSCHYQTNGSHPRAC